MAPKRPAQSSPKTPTKKVKKANGTVNQQTINSFFASPSNSKKPKGTSKNDVINIDSSDDEPGVTSPLSTKKELQSQIEADEELARRLAREGSTEGQTKTEDASESIIGSRIDKGKGKALETSVVPIEEDDEFEIMDPHAKLDPDAPSSSKVKLEPSRPSKSPKGPLASIFNKPALPSVPAMTPKPDIKSDIKPAFPGKASAALASSVSIETFDFDIDAFKFDPKDPAVVERVTKQWPGGRLPYAVLVGIYVQVSGTKSRLLIVRLLTKYVPCTVILYLTKSFLHLLIVHSPIDLPSAIYLLSNHLRPSYIPFELGIGSQILNKQVAEVSGLQSREMRKLWEKWGDPGDVAYESKVSDMIYQAESSPTFAL